MYKLLETRIESPYPKSHYVMKFAYPLRRNRKGKNANACLVEAGYSSAGEKIACK